MSEPAANCGMNTLVAVAIAPRTIASAMDIELPSTKKCSPMSTRSTISVAVSA